MVKTDRKGDVYVFEVATSGFMKASLHFDQGRLRIAETRESARTKGSPRLVPLDQPMPGSLDGWMESVRIMVPCAYLRPEDVDISPSLEVIPTSPAHSAIVVRIFVEHAGAPPMIVHDALPIGILSRGGESLVWVIAQPHSLDRGSITMIAERCSEMREESIERFGVSVGRVVGMIRNEDACMFVDLTTN